MRNLLGGLAFIGVPVLALIGAGYIAQATPEWLQTAVVIGFLVGLPIWALVKVAKWVR